ncbi:MAG: hypothetical protein ABI777_00700 [Betaproteobacteria bacterium]
MTLLSAPVAMAQSPASVPEPAPAVAEVKSIWDAPEPWRTDRFYFQTSVATVHFHPDENHDNTQQLINLEYRLKDKWLEGQWLVGAAVFDNSFGQNSQYVYGGLLWRPFESAQPLYFKLTAGIIHGYKGEYQNKIPFNNAGIAPGILPSMGYCYNRFCSELVLFGTAGMMLTLGATLP